MLNSCRWRRTLAQSVGLMVCGVLVTVSSLPGQTKKDPPKKEPKFISPITPVSISGLEQISFINTSLENQWKENKITPSEPCSDYEFIRRASLDLVGRIATPKELKEFLEQPSQTRRAWLIDRLLQSDDYARNWSNVWTVWLLTRTGANDRAQGDYHEQRLYRRVRKSGAIPSTLFI